jgi:hypothetical protein
VETIRNINKLVGLFFFFRSNFAADDFCHMKWMHLILRKKVEMEFSRPYMFFVCR